MKKSLLAFTLAIITTLLAATPLEVRVLDRELELPLEGATLQLVLSGPGFPAGISIHGETDAEGFAMLELTEGFSRGILAVQFPGYAPTRIQIRPGELKVTIQLDITGVIEGKELVVERKIRGVTDEASGVSVVMEKREMETTANIGLVEDVMNTIKTLPGVTYVGGWNALPSIRGGYPDQMASVLDGVYIIFPFHWGGAFSIFNPNMVQSAKMSHGIFSARYGRAMSGLLDVTTITPEPGIFRFDTIVSTTSFETFVQVPLGKKAGLFTGGKITYMDTLGFLNDEILHNEPNLSETIPTMPFIRDAYAKIWYTPVPSLSLSFNGFFGSDGIGVYADIENEGLRNEASFNWLNLMGFAATNIRWMPGQKTVVKVLGAYNNNTMDMEAITSVTGTRDYSKPFLEKLDTAFDADPDGLINGKTFYSMDGMDMKIDSVQVVQQGQGKAEFDYLLTSSQIFSFGVEEVFQHFSSQQDISGIMPFGDPPNQEYYPITAKMDLEGNRVFNSSCFALWSFGDEASPLRGELGVRGDHFYLTNKSFELNSLPVVNPRASAEWTPIKNYKILNSLTLSAGTGFFSMVPLDSLAADEQFDYSNVTIGPDRSWFQIIGAQAHLQNNWMFRIEGYYKNYFNRLYLTNNILEIDGVPTELTYELHTDGKGFSAGFDLMLQKKDGRHFDGYLTASWVMTKYLNPTSPTEPDDTTAQGEPLDEWFYPDFHRFLSLNLITNWRPFTGLTFTVKGSLATGAPRTKPGEITQNGIKFNDQIIENYSRTELYDESLRNGISCPVDFRVSYTTYKPGSKIRSEIYFALEDVFVNLYKAKGNTSFDRYTGNENAQSGSPDFNIGIPSPSIGYKLSY